MNNNISFTLQLLHKVTFKPPIVYFRTLHLAITSWVRKFIWLGKNSVNNTDIHPSIEIRSAKPYTHLITIGNRCIIEKECTIWIASEAEAHPQLTIESDTYLARNVYLGVYQPLYIGSNSLIGAYSYIITANHRFSDRNMPIKVQGYEGAPVHIGKDVWIGCHTVILPGISIGDGAIIGAGAVVTKSVPAFEIWAGVPAKFLGLRS